MVPVMVPIAVVITVVIVTPFPIPPLIFLGQMVVVAMPITVNFDDPLVVIPSLISIPAVIVIVVGIVIAMCATYGK